MSDQDSTIFNGSADPATPAVSQPVAVDNPAPATTEYNDLLTQIQADDGRQKYTSVPEALKGLAHSQSHIKTLEQELAQLREEVSKRKGVEEILDKINNTNKEQATPATPKLDVNDITNIVEQALQKQQTKATAKQNVTTVISSMKTSFGDKAEELYINAAKENGLSVAQLNKLAETSPRAVLRLVGLDGEKKSDIPAKLPSTINTQALPSTQQKSTASIRVPSGSRTKDVVAGWRAAGDALKSN